jgi:hypothetical protein
MEPVEGYEWDMLHVLLQQSDKSTLILFPAKQ